MAIPRGNPKIRPDHLDRPAFVYVRQSTLFQVLEHTASTARQYDLVQRAEELGWSRASITVIDQDQGLSGASAVDREGFQFLIAQVGLGKAGAVLSLEASRLARSCTDWYRLLEICALTDTLVIDEDGVYDPSQYADRLLLGILGAMSEAELHWLRNRLLGGKLTRAKEGRLRMRPPAGLIYDAARQLVLDPNEEVQQAVRLLFSLFEQTRSALAVVKHFGEHRLLFPDRLWGKDRDGELLWKPLGHGRALDVLHNPRYAGVYVYGRTQTRKRTLPNEPSRIKGRTRRVAAADWPIVRHNAASGVRQLGTVPPQSAMPRRQLHEPRERPSRGRPGRARPVAGLVLCGQCGRRMTARYIRNAPRPATSATRSTSSRADALASPSAATASMPLCPACSLRPFNRAHLAVSLATLEQIEQQARQVDRQWQLRLEGVRYEADLPRRRFVVVDPEYRLVARTLERDWNDKLAEVERLEREYAALPAQGPRLLGPEERQAHPRPG